MNILIEGFKSLDDLSHISHLVYDKYDNKIDIKLLEYLLKNETFYKSACIKKIL